MDPKAKANLLVEEVLDEVLVYDLERHRAHCLNATAGFLLSSADGTRTVAELSTMVEREFGADASGDLVALGLERLRKAGLVEWDASAQAGEGVSRRKMLKVAAVGLLIPTVMTLVSPFPAQAATFIAIGDCNLQNVGKCCNNTKLCVQGRNGKFSCADPGC